ncbi:hypothetical protein AKJ16_DCAP26754 [Drosera capensis]
MRSDFLRSCGAGTSHLSVSRHGQETKIIDGKWELSLAYKYTRCSISASTLHLQTCIVRIYS